MRGTKAVSFAAVCICLVAPSVASAEQLVVTWKKSVARQAAGRSSVVKVIDVPRSQLAGKMSQLRSDYRVATVEKNVRFALTYTPNDPMWGNQWSAPILRMAETWTRGLGQPVVVAVIDSGIDLKHPDLQNSLWVNRGEIAGNRKDDDRNGYVDDINGVSILPKTTSLQDGFGHGTHVSGIIAAGVGNHTGIAGIAPQAKIMTVRAYDNEGVGGLTADLARSIDYAVDNGAQIINASWGRSETYSPALLVAIQKARAKGVIFVAAAGNNRGADNDQRPFYPASYEEDNIIAVASSDQGSNLSSFSNRGVVSVDIAAPGSSIWSTMPAGKYASMSGTSMATPQVVGALALLKGIRPAADSLQLREALLLGVRKTASLDGVVAAGGILDIQGALDSLWAEAPIVGDPYFGPRSVTAPVITLKKNVATCSAGTWSPKPTQISYAWMRGSRTLSSRSSTLTLGNDDYSDPIICKVAAANADGSITVSSQPLEVPAPVVLVKPRVVGTPSSGKKLTCDTGKWMYGPVSVSYQWNVGGESQTSLSAYTAQAADRGKSITCTVTVRNTSGSTVATSAAVVAR